jgi:hypothetical protein
LVFFGGLPLPRLGAMADLVTRLVLNGGKAFSLAGVEASLALCLSPVRKLLGVAVEADLGVARLGVADLGVAVEALGGRPRFLGVTSELDDASAARVVFAFLRLGGSGGGMVLAMVRFGLVAAAVVSKILPRGVVTVEGTSGSGDGARATSFLPFLGGIERCCIDVIIEMVFFVR